MLWISFKKWFCIQQAPSAFQLVWNLRLLDLKSKFSCCEKFPGLHITSIGGDKFLESFANAIRTGVTFHINRLLSPSCQRHIISFFHIIIQIYPSDKQVNINKRNEYSEKKKFKKKIVENARNYLSVKVDHLLSMKNH